MKALFTDLNLETKKTGSVLSNALGLGTITEEKKRIGTPLRRIGNPLNKHRKPLKKPLNKDRKPLKKTLTKRIGNP